jgi:hypothetical protein
MQLSEQFLYTLYTWLSKNSTPNPVQVLEEEPKRPVSNVVKSFLEDREGLNNPKVNYVLNFTKRLAHDMGAALVE